MSTTRNPAPATLPPPHPGAGRSAARTAGRVASVAIVVGSLVLAAALFVMHPNALVTLLPLPDMRELHVDFDTFWHSAVALTQGGDIYDTGAKLRNLNPPLLSLLLAPFAALDALTAYRIWVVITFVITLAAVFWVCRELRLSRGWTVVAVLATAASSPLHGTLVLGQIYPVLLLGLVAGWVAERRGRPVLGAVLYGVTVALKPSLAPLLLLPAVQLRWRPFAAGIGGAAVATLVGILAAGPRSGIEWVRMALVEPVPDVLDNASLPGLAVRAGLPSAIGTVAGAVLLIATYVWIRRHRPVDPAGTAPWAVLAAGLLMSPISWHNYLMLLTPGLLVALSGGLSRYWTAALLAVPVIPVAWGDLWPDGTPFARVGRSLYCAILLAYWLTLVLSTRRAAEDPRHAVERPAV